MSAELLYALDELEKDKGIDREVIIAAIEEGPERILREIGNGRQHKG